jgi:hypothetical protein
MTKANESLNYYISILAVITLIGILFFPAISAGKIIHYGPVPSTNITIPAVKYTTASLQFIIPEKIPIVINESTDQGSTIPQYTTFSDLNYPTFPKDSAIRTAVESVG